MRCDLCRQAIQTTFLNKIKGIYLGPGKKKKAVCSLCQKSYTTNEIKKKLGLEE